MTNMTVAEQSNVPFLPFWEGKIPAIWVFGEK